VTINVRTAKSLQLFRLAHISCLTQATELQLLSCVRRCTSSSIRCISSRPNSWTEDIIFWDHLYLVARAEVKKHLCTHFLPKKAVREISMTHEDGHTGPNSRSLGRRRMHWCSRKRPTLTTTMTMWVAQYKGSSNANI